MSQRVLRASEEENESEEVMIVKRDKFCRTGAAEYRESFHLAYDVWSSLHRTVGDNMMNFFLKKVG